MKNKVLAAHHSSTCAGEDLSYRPGGGDVEQIDTCESSVDYNRQDEDQYQDYLKRELYQYNIAIHLYIFLILMHHIDIVCSLYIKERFCIGFQITSLQCLSVRCIGGV